jgi:two-component sensor histidine kinase
MSDGTSNPARYFGRQVRRARHAAELVTNAIQHVHSDGTGTIGVTLTCARNPDAVTVMVSDSSPRGPVMREASTCSERGRGLQIVAALSAHWGWRPEGGGKAIFATLAQEAGA